MSDVESEAGSERAVTTPAYAGVCRALAESPRQWLVTGAAGFIGSALVERLLGLGQTVRGLDNFATGHAENLDDVRRRVGADAWERFRFFRGDIREPDDCRLALDGLSAPARAGGKGGAIVLHQAALGSVPKSIDDPVECHRANVDGFVNMIVAARDAGAGRFVYASSSAVYGDEPTLPKVESRIGRALSPYAVSKRVNELYAGVFSLTYRLPCVGLRYFNVFGPRQDPAGAYAAVIPQWIGQLLSRRRPTINGDGSITRDFCPVENVVQANLLAGASADPRALDQVYNVAVGGRMTLKELFVLIRDALSARDPGVAGIEPILGQPRPGDITDSQADVSLARDRLGYEPGVGVREAIARTAEWFASRSAPRP